jgi:hypothetical protein
MSFERKMKAAILLIIAAYIAVMLSACMTPKKAVDYLKKKDLLADTCAANYPVKADTIYKPGELIIETEYLPGDTLYFFDTVSQWRIDTIKKVCPPSQVSTIWRVDTLAVTVVDSALVATLRGKYNASVKDATEWEAKAKRRGKMQWAFIGLSALLFVLVGFILGKKLKL